MEEKQHLTTGMYVSGATGSSIGGSVGGSVGGADILFNGTERSLGLLAFAIQEQKDGYGLLWSPPTFLWFRSSVGATMKRSPAYVHTVLPNFGDC